MFRLGGSMRGRVAPRAASFSTGPVVALCLQAAVLILRGQGQVKQQASEVVEVTEGRAGAAAAGSRVSIGAVLPGFLPRSAGGHDATDALLTLLMFLHLGVQAVPLLFRHTTKLHR